MLLVKTNHRNKTSLLTCATRKIKCRNKLLGLNKTMSNTEYETMYKFIINYDDVHIHEYEIHYKYIINYAQ